MQLKQVLKIQPLPFPPPRRGWVLLLAVFLLPLGAFAYTDTNISGTMLVDVSPQNPAPGETVTLKMTSYGTDLNRANITWSGNGAPFKTGIGERTVLVKVGPAGTETRITITARTVEGEIQEKVVTFRPAGVDLLWQAHTSVPPYYRGRALPTAGSNVTIVAEPDFIDSTGRRLDAASLVYEWSRNGNKLEDPSGYGKYSLEVTDLSSFSNESISVKITDLSGSLIAEKTLAVPALSPRLAIYEDHPLLGTKFETAIRNTFDIMTEEVTLRGETYFYPLKSLVYRINPRWTVNDKLTTTDGAAPNLITLRQSGNQVGTALVTFSIETNSASIQSLQIPFTVRFGAEQIRF